MLTKILSRAECAKCQICCSFDSYDLWETPVITDEVQSLALEIAPQQKFSYASGARLFRMEREPNEDLYFCPMLDRKKGCMLGENKPFVLSPVCPTVFKKPVEEVKALADELAPRIFAEADKTPEMVKPYISGYVILTVEKK